jgi:putative membrane protein
MDAPSLLRMSIAAAVLVVLVALLHVYFLVLEMFLWSTPYGRKVFGTTEEAAASGKVLAANQGLYNGFLAAGLLWGLGVYGVVGGRPILTFFLACVAVAGIYGGISVNKRILFVQTVPAVIALALVWLA